MSETLSAVIDRFGLDGCYTATYVNTDGAAAYFYPGFVPKLVIVVNITTAEINVWFRGMADASSLSVILAAAYNSSNGITVSQDDDATSTQGPWLKLGTAILNANETVKIYAK